MDHRSLTIGAGAGCSEGRSRGDAATATEPFGSEKCHSRWARRKRAARCSTQLTAEGMFGDRVQLVPFTKHMRAQSCMWHTYMIGTGVCSFATPQAPTPILADHSLVRSRAAHKGWNSESREDAISKKAISMQHTDRAEDPDLAMQDSSIGSAPVRRSTDTTPAPPPLPMVATNIATVCSSSSPQGDITVPSGTYTVSSIINVPAGCNIILLPEWQGQTELISSGDGVFTVDGHLTMYGLELSGPPEVAASASLVSVNGGGLQTFGCTFRDNDISSVSGAAAGDGEGSGKAPCCRAARGQPAPSPGAPRHRRARSPLCQHEQPTLSAWGGP